MSLLASSRQAPTNLMATLTTKASLQNRKQPPTVRLSSRTTPSNLKVSTADTFQLSIAQSLVCGAVARAAQVSSLFPVDTIKTRVQAARVTTTSGSSATATAPLRNAITRGRFYSGLGINLLGQVPYAMLTFGLYEALKTRFSDSRLNMPEWLRIMLAAAIGDTVGSLWLTPSEVVKSKTQAGIYSSPMSAIRAVSANGPLYFYQGFGAALARDVPFRAIQLFLYEKFRRAYISRFAAASDSVSSLENLLIGAWAGTLGAIATTPLDVIRTRMMSQPVGNLATYKSVLDCVVKTFSKEGPLAFFKGVGPRVILIGPASAVFFLTYEATKGYFRSRHSSRTRPQRVAARFPNTCSRRRSVLS